MGRGKPTFAEAIKQRLERPLDSRTIVRSFDDVQIAWSRSQGGSSPLPPFPFHIYLIRGATSLNVTGVLTDKLLCYISGWQQLCDPCWHLEVFTTVQDNVFACIEHYEQEQTSRRLDCEKPYMSDKTCFLVVDSDEWEDEGLLCVEYTNDAHLPYGVKAERYKSWDSLATRLREQWSYQGMTTIEELLDERNLARGWSIDLNLYPDSGPEKSVNGMSLIDDEQASTALHPSALNVADLVTVLSADVDGVVEEPRQDSRGNYTALKHASSEPPLFVFCLFVLGRDISSSERLSVFARLNSGLMAGVSWSLHLYSNATMSSASSIFARDMASRNSSAGTTKHPSSYAGTPQQNYKHVYMYLAATDSPSFVLSVPISDHVTSLPSDVSSTAGESDSIDLITFNPGSWDLAADMLHTYLVVCSEAQPIARSPSPPLPRISLHISVNSEYSSDSESPSPMGLTITSHASEPITLNVRDTIFDTSSWHSYLLILDATSSREISRNDAAKKPSSHLQVWTLGPKLLDYGFSQHVEETDEVSSPHLVTLHSGVPLQLPVLRPLPTDFLAELRPEEDEDDKVFLEEHEAGGEACFNPSDRAGVKSLYGRYQSWEVGKRYRVSLRQGTSIPRWTWGTGDELKGPYRLPALDIEVEEGGNKEFVLI
ncbi:hypothetical protein AUEXF2481DRAFT_33263 [Aureobasidium subglaciale EXF-2481]|uniref:Uncharacterized protein n=1 Tax=Aureobasidium subglaciale (strain EXF-2481) TaxID=1043005 RepID=A0A074Y0J0_AURSE|nr:uncharacterized protein AUEXF2481DRAFT_33263 [Aureobasidium subglaciale EXF-2481]KAI5194102.1 hypothetical protein E4T38_09714 [Aureobasidium subglaciale]KAI5213486.1 hypothetical protein E4T40_09686 [Aureobasidium subglaciale]KAI5215160.1 hypothetical protein E4T41_09716 [Aureobasidium subglaciale]KAI5253198.1 hypothetical protein E4T46_09691 [Aureobasidium subglaciale]KEQ91313.1 hypothetical protein AUEXF2481DRAFT_33263 [Aureobasidium subglaciale EXF-2481]